VLVERRDGRQLPRPRSPCFNRGRGNAMNRLFYGFFFFFPRLLAEGNG